MTTLFESPWPVIFCGVVAEAILGAVFLGSRRVIFLLPMAIVLVLVLSGVALERMVVTQREEVEATLDGLAAALEANDVEGALGYLSPSAGATRGRAQWALDRFKVTKAKISGLEITVNKLTNPPSATAAFTGSLGLFDRRGEVPTSSYPISFTAEFRKEGDRWLVTKHTEDVPSFGVRRSRRDPNGP